MTYIQEAYFISGFTRLDLFPVDSKDFQLICSISYRIFVPSLKLIL
jgi:hypothetical protein